MEKEKMFYNKIKAFCRQKELFSKGDRVLLGLSGGADSVCLFLVLQELAKEWELTVLPVHINHNLRGEEALADQQFCEELCQSHQEKLTVVSMPVAALAKEHGWSLEEAGRNVRYEAFVRLAGELHCHKIAVAHHKDDQAETVLFQMFRGCRMKGLSGIEPKSGILVRPFLDVTREEIEAYLTKKEQRFCIDSTNLEEEYTRNKIRHRIMPTAKEVCTGAVGHIAELAEYAGEVEQLLERLTQELFRRCAVVDADGTVSLKIAELEQAEHLLVQRVMYRALCLACGRKKDITAGFVTDCMNLMKKQSGRRVTLPGGVVARKSFQLLVLGREPEAAKTFFLEVSELPFEAELPKNGEKIRLVLKNRAELEENIPKSTYTKWFDYDKINNVIALRTPEPQDELSVYADGRKKSLTAVLAEAKVPREQRQNLPVLAAGHQVLWIPGGRSSEGYRVTDATKRVLIATINGGNKDGQ